MTELRETFEQAAATYHQARPRYPEALYDAMARSTGAGAASAVLELGPATGVATEVLADRFGSVVAVELGAELAAAAKANLAGRENVEIVHASFDDWEPDTWNAFDLVVAATCWHWMDGATKYERARRHLRPGGHLVFWAASHVIPVDGDPFFAEIQDVYDEIGEGLDEWVELRPGQVRERRDQIEESGCFEVVAIEQFDWEVVYDAEGYIALLDTFSGHIAMEPWQRDRLYGEIRRRLSSRPSGTLRRHYGAALHIAKRLD